MAIGASRGAVLRLVLRPAVARFVASRLFGVTPFDAATLAGVSVLLAVVALLASYIPAYRAAQADPMNSLRYE
jgi:ABC-type lipoprotein release transport system permease subunit